MRHAVFPYLVILFGLFVCGLAFPRFHRATMGWLQQEKILPSKKLKPKNRELVASAGPAISLLLAGVVITLLGLALAFLYV